MENLQCLDIQRQLPSFTISFLYSMSVLSSFSRLIEASPKGHILKARKQLPNTTSHLHRSYFQINHLFWGQQMENNIPEYMALMRTGGPVLTAEFTRSPEKFLDWIKMEYWHLLRAEEILPFPFSPSHSRFDIVDLWERLRLAKLFWPLRSCSLPFSHTPFLSWCSHWLF